VGRGGVSFLVNFSSGFILKFFFFFFFFFFFVGNIGSHCSTFMGFGCFNLGHSLICIPKHQALDIRTFTLEFEYACLSNCSCTDFISMNWAMKTREGFRKIKH
jgi:hypothetical protein